jgi:peptidoglycan/xylan/chitin deacetylase (PgdA/CDA1 family)
VSSSSDYAYNVIRGLGNGSSYVVLQHDTNINSIRAVSTIIEYGISHGYSFGTLDVNGPIIHHGIAN